MRRSIAPDGTCKSLLLGNAPVLAARNICKGKRKVGNENLADALTKYLACEELRWHAGESGEELMASADARGRVISPCGKKGERGSAVYMPRGNSSQHEERMNHFGSARVLKRNVNSGVC